MNNRLVPSFATTALAAAAITLLAGCAGGPQTRADYFLLDPGAPPSFAAMRRSGSAAVSFVDVGLPSAGGGFVYKLSPTTWETDPYNQFLVSPAQMFTSLIRKWLADSDQFRVVADPSTGGGQDWNIVCRVSELYGDFQNPFAPEAVMVLHVQVFGLKNQRRTLALESKYEQRVPIAERSPEAIVEAWNAALRNNLMLMSRDLGQGL